MIPEDTRDQGFKGSSERIWKKDNSVLYQDAIHILWFCLRTGNADTISRAFKLNRKSELSRQKKDIAETERMLKALIKSLENKPLNP